MSKSLFLILLACMGIILAGCASSADKSNVAIDSGSISEKKVKTAEAESPSLVKPVLRVVPELLRHNDSSPNNLLLDYSGCKSGLTYDDCKEEASKTEEELREEAYDTLSDKWLGTSGSKKGKFRLKPNRIEWRIKF